MKSKTHSNSIDDLKYSQQLNNAFRTLYDLPVSNKKTVESQPVSMRIICIVSYNTALCCITVSKYIIVIWIIIPNYGAFISWMERNIIIKISKLALVYLLHLGSNIYDLDIAVQKILNLSLFLKSEVFVFEIQYALWVCCGSSGAYCGWVT